MNGDIQCDYKTIPMKCGHIGRSVETALRRLCPLDQWSIIRNLWIDGIGKHGRRLSLTIRRERLSGRDGRLKIENRDPIC